MAAARSLVAAFALLAGGAGAGAQETTPPPDTAPAPQAPAKSTFDIYGTLSVGGQLHMVPSSFNLLPQRLAEFIRASELTQWFSAPAALEQLVQSDAIEPDDFPTLKRVLWSGGALGTQTLIHWMTRVPHVASVVGSRAARGQRLHTRTPP